MAVGYVLAGGRSRRMGIDKARLPVSGPDGVEPMALAVMRALGRVCESVCLVRRGGPDGLPWRFPKGLAYSVCWEPDEGSVHPLWGVAYALEHAASDPVVIAPCDMAALDSDVVKSMVECARAPGVIAVSNGVTHPLLSVLWRELAPQARRLAGMDAPVRRFAESLKLVDVPSPCVRNINRPEDAGPDPISALSAQLSWMDPLGRKRVLEGEIARLAARGVVSRVVGAAGNGRSW